MAEWKRAACRFVDPELFFPIGTSGPALIQIENAKAVCHVCPIEVACLDDALSQGREFGIWGGRTEGERQAILRRRPINEGNTGEAHRAGTELARRAPSTL